MHSSYHTVYHRFCHSVHTEIRDMPCHNKKNRDTFHYIKQRISLLLHNLQSCLSTGVPTGMGYNNCYINQFTRKRSTPSRRKATT